jgi:hypothetical protein
MTNDESKTGNLIIALGIVLLIVGIVVALIPRTERQCVSVLLVEVCENVTVFPYALIGWPIFIIGLILAIAGAVMIGSSRQSPQPQPQQPYYAQPVSPYPAQQQAPPQYAPQPYPQQQPAPIGTCGYCCTSAVSSTAASSDRHMWILRKTVLLRRDCLPGLQVCSAQDAMRTSTWLDYWSVQ